MLRFIPLHSFNGRIRAAPCRKRGRIITASIILQAPILRSAHLDSCLMVYKRGSSQASDIQANIWIVCGIVKRLVIVNQVVLKPLNIAYTLKNINMSTISLLRCASHCLQGILAALRKLPSRHIQPYLASISIIDVLVRYEIILIIGVELVLQAHVHVLWFVLTSLELMLQPIFLGVNAMAALVVEIIFVVTLVANLWFQLDHSAFASVLLQRDLGKRLHM